MKRILYLILSIIFLACGIVGLIFPVVPQVPFFVMSVVCASLASEKIKNAIKSTKLYQNHLRKHVKKYKITREVFEESADEPDKEDVSESKEEIENETLSGIRDGIENEGLSDVEDGIKNESISEIIEDLEEKK